MQNPRSSKSHSRTVNIPLVGKRKKKRKRDRDCCLIDEIFDNTCFVATAAYGDNPVAEPVRTLRRYRDKRLARTVQGRLFIRAYYRYGPYGAAVVRRYPRLKPAVRFALRPIVAYARKRVR